MCSASLGDLCQATAESVLALSSTVKKVHWTLWPLKLALQLETSGTNHSVTRRQIPEDIRPQLYLYESLKNRIK
jgi:hypothetical protein